MICGIITIVIAVVIKMPNYSNQVSIQLPEEITLPEKAKVVAFSVGSKWYFIVTENDEILIYDRYTNILNQIIKIK